MKDDTFFTNLENYKQEYKQKINKAYTGIIFNNQDKLQKVENELINYIIISFKVELDRISRKEKSVSMYLRPIEKNLRLLNNTKFTDLTDFQVFCWIDRFLLFLFYNDESIENNKYMNYITLNYERELLEDMVKYFHTYYETFNNDVDDDDDEYRESLIKPFSSYSSEQIYINYVKTLIIFVKNDYFINKLLDYNNKFNKNIVVL